jgi:SAM-dependent methyltransferase
MKNNKLLLSVTIFVTLINTVLIASQFQLFKKQKKFTKNIESFVTMVNADSIKEASPKPVESSDQIIKAPINRTIFFSMIDQNKSMLEVGPYYSPIMKGEKVKYFDVLDREHLTAKAITENLETKNIPHIDYVEPNGDLSIIKDKFDIVFSSHNIEHQVDLISHLNQVASLLNEGGEFYLAVPDKRYCFDHFVPATPLSDIIATHEVGAKTHSLQTILAKKCEITHNDSTKHWSGDHGEMEGQNNLNCYTDALKYYHQAAGGYIDAHKWRFIPTSFSYIIKSLNELGLISLKIESIYATEPNSHEFYVIMTKTGK